MKHIREFDGLRGLLALWVFASHVVEVGPYPWLAPPIRPNLAVDLFIILSGFVIFHLLATGEDYRTFITRRWFRLFPVFAVCFLIALTLYGWLALEDPDVFGIGQKPRLMPYLVTHATLLHGAVPEAWLARSARAILVPAWSISLEWQFYLAAPLLFALAQRPNRKLALFALGLVGLRLWHDAAHAGLPIPGRSTLVFDMRAFLPLNLEFFAVGAGSYAVWKWLSERSQPWRVPRLCWALFVPVVILVAKRSPAIALWLGGFFVLAQVHFGGGGIFSNRFSRAFNSRPAQLLGKLSYCIYLLHLPVLILARHLLSPLSLPPAAFQSVLIVAGLSATIAGSWLLHVTIEQPMIAFGKQLTKTWKRSPAAPAPVEGATPA